MNEPPQPQPDASAVFAHPAPDNQPHPSPYTAPQQVPWPQNPAGTPSDPWTGNQWGQAPGWAPPAKKRRSRWWFALPVLAFVVFAGCGTLLFKGGVEVKHATDSVNDYARALVAGRYADAYAMRCDADRASMSLEQFTAEPVEFRDYTIDAVNVTRANGETTGEAHVRFTVKDAPDLGLVFALRKIGGKWQPCNS